MVFAHFQYRIWVLITPLVFLSIHCSGGRGSDGGDGGGIANLVGSISSASGSQTEMNSWVVVLTESGGLSRVSEVDGTGVLNFKSVRVSEQQSLVLLSPDFILQAVLSLPGAQEKQVRHFFKVSGTSIPRVVHKGKVLNMSSLNGVEMQNLYAKDTDGDGIPDGAAVMNLASVDTDLDGVENTEDPDIDGDGILNWFDEDDDGDGTLDVVDSDANGNLTADLSEKLSDLYFKSGFEFIHVQHHRAIQSSGPAKNFLVFTTQLRQDAGAVRAVKVRGATTLLEGSKLSDGSIWDRSLKDDGQSEDGSAGDLLYSRKVELASGVSARSGQVLFFQLEYGDGEQTYTVEAPFTFPNVSLSSFAASMDSSRNVTVVGDPFGSLTNYKWTVSVFNSNKLKIYESSENSGSTRSVTVPANIMPSGAQYSYVITAKLGERISGLPSYVVKSIESTISL